MKIYISGQITGLPNNNAEQFEEAEKLVKKMGYKPVNPLKLHHRKNAKYKQYLRKDLRALRRCQVILMLEGWEHSKGAEIELEKAKKWRKKVIFQKD